LYVVSSNHALRKSCRDFHPRETTRFKHLVKNVFVFLVHCFLGCIECYFYYFYFFFYYLFLLSISFFFFDMDHWSDTNK